MNNDDKNLLIFLLIGGGIFFVIVIVVGYIFLFGARLSPVTPVDPVPPVVDLPTATTITTQCKISGCSSQLCVNSDEDITTDCQYKEEYACYTDKFTKCEIQEDGECGWTETLLLAKCLEGETLE
jgi:hypothetical protein